jgi:uncharacterized protein YndB with AHSA1/START domain
MSNDVGAGTRIIGSLRSADGRGVVRMEDLFDTDIDDLWSALTSPARAAAWIAEVAGDLRPGGSIQMRFTSGWEGPGRVDVCDAPRRLVLTQNPGAADATVIEAWLSPEGSRTRLVIEERGLPLETISAYGAGWQAHVEDLVAHLAGRDRSEWIDRLVELRPAYEDLAGDLNINSEGR